MVTIICDPGHGGTDSGASANGYIEKDLNLKTALLLKKKLEEYKDARVILTRDIDINLSLKQRGDIAKQNKADMLISVHFNSYTSTAKGFEAIYSYNSMESKVIAESIFNEVIKLGLHPRGVWTKKSSQGEYNYYGILRNTAPIPAIIVEGLFLTNTEDIKFLKKAEFLDNLASAYCQGIVNYFGLKKVKEMTWLEILQKISANPQDWEKAINTMVKLAKEANIGELDIFQYLPDLIEKIYNNK